MKLTIQIELGRDELGRCGYIRLWNEGGIWFDRAPKGHWPKSWWKPDIEFVEIGSYEIWWRSHHVQLDLPGWRLRRKARQAAA